MIIDLLQVKIACCHVREKKSKILHRKKHIVSNLYPR